MESRHVAVSGALFPRLMEALVDTDNAAQEVTTTNITERNANDQFDTGDACLTKAA